MGNGTEGTDEGPRRSAPTTEELQRRFFYHQPRDEKAKLAHQEVSDIAFQAAVRLCIICPPGRNLDLALQALELVRMRANAAIAVDDPRP
jgi:hypothetical protein